MELEKDTLFEQRKKTIELEKQKLGELHKIDLEQLVQAHGRDEENVRQ